MTPWRLRVSLACLLALASLWPATLHGQQPQLCSEWKACQQMALGAAGRGEYELATISRGEPFKPVPKTIRR